MHEEDSPPEHESEGEDNGDNQDEDYQRNEDTYANEHDDPHAAAADDEQDGDPNDKGVDDNPTKTDAPTGLPFAAGERVLAYHQARIYEARVTEVRLGEDARHFRLHYHGWNDRWDEWVSADRILKHNEANIKKKRVLDDDMTTKKKKKPLRGESPATSSDEGLMEERRAKKKKALLEPAQPLLSFSLPQKIQRALADDWAISLDGSTVSVVGKPSVADVLTAFLTATSNKTATSMDSGAYTTPSDATTEEESEIAIRVRGKEEYAHEEHDREDEDEREHMEEHEHMEEDDRPQTFSVKLEGQVTQEPHEASDDSDTERDSGRDSGRDSERESERDGDSHEAVVQLLRAHFNRVAAKTLLYAHERKRGDIYVRPRKKEPATYYALPMLLRFLVVLPRLIVVEHIEPEALEALHYSVKSLLRYLVEEVL